MIVRDTISRQARRQWLKVDCKRCLRSFMSGNENIIRNTYNEPLEQANMASVSRIIRKTVPSHIARPSYAYSGNVPYSRYSNSIMIHEDEEAIIRMRRAAQLAHNVLKVACTMAQVGVTTDEIDTVVHETIIEHGAYPSPLNYNGFPKSLCSSVNEVICHGIPDNRPLQFGDIVSFDVSCYLDTVHGDNCATVIVGDTNDKDNNVLESNCDSDNNSNRNDNCDWMGTPYKVDFDNSGDYEHFVAARRLVNATRESLYAGINACKPGGCLSDIGCAIHDVADKYGYSTVEKYRGHGIHHEFHCPPYVKHFRNEDRLQLVPGMIFTIEPMLTEGSSDCFEWDDQWTVATVNCGLAAQFEHTVLITDTGVEILTIS